MTYYSDSTHGLLMDQSGVMQEIAFDSPGQQNGRSEDYETFPGTLVGLRTQQGS